MASGVRLHYANLITASGVAFTPSSEQTALPASNVANPQRTRVWRTGTSVALEAVVFDLGSAQSVTSVVIDNHNLTSGDSLIKIQGNATDSWGSPSVNETITYAADTMYKVFAGGSYRYWRFTFTKSAAGETRDIGNVFLGAYANPDRDPDRESGYTCEPVSRSISTESLGGQAYSLQRDPVKKIGIKWSKIDATHKGLIDALTLANDTHTPFYLYLAGVHDTPVQVKLEELPSLPITGGVSSAYLYDIALKMRSQL